MMLSRRRNHYGRMKMMPSSESRLKNVGHCRQTRYTGRHIGEALVKDCLTKAKGKGSAIMQFNAVVATNASAIHLYAKLGFFRLGVIPKGYKKNA